MHETLKLPGYMAELIDKGVLGHKTGGGFFKRGEQGSEDGDLVLVPATGDYVPQSTIAMPEMPHVGEIADLYSQGRYVEGLAVLLDAKGAEAALARKVMAGYIAYSFERVGEVCASINDIDRIMGMGFNWAPPSVLVDTMGAPRAVAMIREAGLAVPAALADAAPDTTFFNHPTINIGRFFVAA